MKSFNLLSTEIIKRYKEGQSPYEIAQALNTYANKVRRLLIKAGIELRDHSKAQSLALTSGRTDHPTKGKKRSEATKRAIGEKVYAHWQNKSEEEKEKWVENCRAKWESLSSGQKQHIYKLAGEGIRRAAKEGSSLEKFLNKFLTERGFDVIFHKKGLIPADKLEVDIFLPALKTIIEIDGPTHFLPIWGEDKLRQVMSADAHKSGLLLAEGYVIVRVKYIVKKLSNKRKIDLGEKVAALLADIRNEFPDANKRFIEIEV